MREVKNLVFSVCVGEMRFEVRLEESQVYYGLKQEVKDSLFCGMFDFLNVGERGEMRGYGMGFINPNIPEEEWPIYTLAYIKRVA